MAKQGKAAGVADLFDAENAGSNPAERREVVAAPDDGWRDIETITTDETDGNVVVLTADRKHQGRVCMWRTSREFVAGPEGRGGRFQAVGFWSERNTGGQRITWEPIAWRPYAEPAYEPKP